MQAIVSIPVPFVNNCSCFPLAGKKGLGGFRVQSSSDAPRLCDTTTWCQKRAECNPMATEWLACKYLALSHSKHRNGPPVR